MGVRDEGCLAGSFRGVIGRSVTTLDKPTRAPSAPTLFAATSDSITVQDALCWLRALVPEVAFSRRSRGLRRSRVLSVLPLLVRRCSFRLSVRADDCMQAMCLRGGLSARTANTAVSAVYEACHEVADAGGTGEVSVGNVMKVTIPGLRPSTGYEVHCAVL